MKCEICNTEQTVRSMAMHLKHNHQLKTDEYVKKYNEFRPKNIKNTEKTSKSDVKCNICNQEMMHNRQLMYHLTKKHPNIEQKDYIIKYEFGGIEPKCGCGCGEITTFLRHGKDSNNKDSWFRKYIKGHWDWVKQGYNSHSRITKDLMSEKAKQRILEEVKKQGYANMHNPVTLEERRIFRKEISIKRIENIHDVIIINKDEISTTSTFELFKFQCNKCKLEWNQKTSCARCISCNPYNNNNISKEEQEVVDFIYEYYNKTKIILNSRKHIRPYEIDIFIPEFKLGIEYNGLYWHSEINKKDKNYHYKKYNSSKDADIKLIQIFSDEWINKREIVKSRILNELKLTPNKIYGRECIIKEIIIPKIKNEFLDENHIQGQDRSKIKLGLYYNNDFWPA